MRFALDTTPVSSTSTKTRTTEIAKKARRTVGRAAITTVESLERRQLLTSVAAGQIGVFQGADGDPVMVRLNGSSGSLDFIGATRDQFGSARLNDIPMTIFDADTGAVIRENLGGFAGRKGIQLADFVFNNDIGDSEFVGEDPAGAPISPYPNPPSGRINIDGLASNSRGRSYGVNRYLSSPGNVVVDVLRVDSKAGNVGIDSDVSAEVLAQLQLVNPLFTSGDILSVIGADFPPDNAGLLYFALNVNFPTSSGGATPTITRKSVPAMFTYNLVTKEVVIDPNLFGFSNSDDTIRIDDFTFLDDGRIAMFGSVQFGQGGQPQVGMFFSDADAVVPNNFQVVRIGEQAPGQPLPAATTSLAAIEAIPGEDYIVAITDSDAAGGADDAQLVRIDIATGRGREIGAVVNPDEPSTVTSRLGENITDLAFNPRIVDQYFQPGKRGGLLGAEGTRDQLVAIDIRERFQNSDLYAIYGNKVSPDLSLAVSNFTLDANAQLPFNRRLYLGLMNPFSGTAGAVLTNMVPGDPVPVNLPNGGLYIGIRTADQNNGLTVPVLSLSSRTDFAGSGAGVALPRNVRPGVYITGTMKDILIGGTITGSVNINGSVDTFYAGNVITGDPLGNSQGPVVNLDDNFFVNGDMRNLVVNGGLGTLAGAPAGFSSGTDFRITGRVQQIKAGTSFRGSLDIVGNTSEQTIGSRLTELEYVPPINARNGVELAFQGVADSGNFRIADDVVRNDTFETEQIIGSYFSRSRKRGGQFTLNGTINNGTNFGDARDYYGVPMLAGQSMNVQLDGGLLTTLEIIDPDGRVYATDLSNHNDEDFLNQALRVTADKPGVWRLAVVAEDPTLLVNGDRPYTLTVDKIGEMAIGGLVTPGNAYFDRLDLGLRARSGDLGAIQAGGRIEAADVAGFAGRDQTFTNPIIASTGNIRALDATSFGRRETGVVGLFPNITAPQGSVGLLRTDDFMYFNALGLSLNTLEPVPDAIIGGDYQVIEAGGDLSGVITANGSVGVIRAASFGQEVQNLPGFIGINLDGRGTAELGLMDIVGNLGTFEFGGPALAVGNGGNARYLRVGGLVYRPYRVGSGGLINLTGQDEPVEVLDDSGATIRILPYDGVNTSTTVTEGGGVLPGQIPDPFGGNGNPANGSNGIPDPFGSVGNRPGTSNLPPDPFNGANNPNTVVIPVPNASDVVGTLSVSGYPVIGGGYMVYNVASTTGVVINVSGEGSGDIGQLTSTGIGFTGLTSPVVNPSTALDPFFTNPTRRQQLLLGNGTTLDMIFNGSRVNVFDIDAVTPTGELLNIARVLNNTDGEIINVRAADVGFMTSEWIGVSRPVNGVKIEGLTDIADPRFSGIANAAPFNGQRNAIFIDNAIDIRARGPLGNIISNGIVQSVSANSDRVNVKGVNEGIVAPIVMPTSTPEAIAFGFRRIDIGEGLSTSGSGNFSQGGIFSNGSIGLITNDNGGGDLRGDVIGARYIEGIRLSGGASILNADIIQPADDDLVLDGRTNFAIGLEDFRVGLDIVGNPTNRRQLFGIGDIRTSGNGGMMNTRIVGYNMGRIILDDAGFGMVQSDVSSTSGATMLGVSAGGLGIRSSFYTGGSDIGDVVATGSGRRLSVRNFSRSVRVRESGYFDVTGIAPNAATDINLFLGTTPKRPSIEGVTNSGVIQDSIIAAGRRINAVRAFEIRGVETLGARPRDESYSMQIAAPNEIGTVATSRNINGLRLTGGSMQQVSAGRDILQFALESNGRVGAITAGRNILGTSHFEITGNGSLDLLKVTGNVNGTGFASRGIRTIDIGGNLGSARAQGGLRSAVDIQLLRVGGNINENAFIRANRTIKSVVLGGDLQDNATIRAKNINAQQIGGEIDGDIIVG